MKHSEGVYSIVIDMRWEKSEVEVEEGVGAEESK